MKKYLKKITKFFIIYFFFILFLINIIIFLPGKNKQEYIACFESKQMAYRSFRNISYVPKILSFTTFFIKYPTKQWKIPAKCSFYKLMQIFKQPNELAKLYKITFPEGITKTQAKKIILENPNLNYLKEFEISEGFIFPDTYLFKKNTTCETIIKQANLEMQKKTTHFWQPLEKKALKYNLKLPINKKEFLILASIVQKEASYYEDLKKIAACLLLRLQIGIRLHSCATVLYGLEEEGHEIYKKNNVPMVLKKHTLIKTKYNTYLLNRFPIGPICMPGKLAFKALYEVIDDALEHTISNTNGKNGINNKKLIYKNASLYFYSCNGKILYANHLTEHRTNIKNCKLITNQSA